MPTRAIGLYLTLAGRVGVNSRLCRQRLDPWSSSQKIPFPSWMMANPFQLLIRVGMKKGAVLPAPVGPVTRTYMAYKPCSLAMGCRR